MFKDLFVLWGDGLFTLHCQGKMNFLGIFLVLLKRSTISEEHLMEMMIRSSLIEQHIYSIMLWRYEVSFSL